MAALDTYLAEHPQELERLLDLDNLGELCNYSSFAELMRQADRKRGRDSAQLKRLLKIGYDKLPKVPWTLIPEYQLMQIGRRAGLTAVDCKAIIPELTRKGLLARGGVEVAPGKIVTLPYEKDKTVFLFYMDAAGFPVIIEGELADNLSCPDMIRRIDGMYDLSSTSHFSNTPRKYRTLLRLVCLCPDGSNGEFYDWGGMSMKFSNPARPSTVKLYQTGTTYYLEVTNPSPASAE